VRILTRVEEFEFSILLHHGRSRQHSGGNFQVVQIFTAEVLGKTRVISFARNLNHTQNHEVLI